MAKPVGYAAGLDRVADELELALSDLEALTRAELAERAELSESRAGDILAELVRAGAVGHDNGRPRRYVLASLERLAEVVELAMGRP